MRAVSVRFVPVRNCVTSGIVLLDYMWSMDGPHTPISVYWRVIFFGTPYTCVMHGVSVSATGVFPAVRLGHSLLKYFFTFQL